MAKGTLEESAKFAAKLIRKNPKISMAELKKAARPHGIRIYPRAIGEAKVSLGMGKKKARRSKRKTTKRKSTRRKATKRKGTRKNTAKRRGTRKKTAKRRTRRKKATRRRTTRRRTAATPAAALSQIASEMRALERETASLRKALARIADLASRV